MDEDEVSQREGLSDEYSLRSRASSIISTGTKTSIGTFASTPSTGCLPFSPASGSSAGPVEETTTAGNSIDVLLGRRNFRIATRPGSMLSISSYDVPAPPYSEAIKTPDVPIDSWGSCHNSHPRDQDFEPALRRPSLDARPRRPNSVRFREPISSTASSIHENLSPVHEDSPSPPINSFDSNHNALSAHYTNVVRTIDANHHAELARLEAAHQAQLSALRNELEVAHEAALEERDISHDNALEEYRNDMSRSHQVELATTRNEVDRAYRAEFARMDDELTTLRTEHAQALRMVVDLEAQVKTLAVQVTELKEETGRLERDGDERERRARNQVEDTWEGRWKVRMALAAEQIARMSRETELVHEEWEKRLAAGDNAEVRIRRNGNNVAEKVRLAVKEIMEEEERQAKTEGPSGKTVKKCGPF